MVTGIVLHAEEFVIAGLGGSDAGILLGRRLIGTHAASRCIGP